MGRYAEAGLIPRPESWAPMQPRMGSLDAFEQEAVGFAIGVLSAHAGDTRLHPRVRDAFAEHAGRLQQLLDRAKLSLNH